MDKLTLNNKKKQALRILIVDDHPLVRRGLADLISDEADLCVCGEATGTNEALTIVDTEKPDLVIVDISLGDGNGLELVKQIKAQHENIKMLVLSMHDEELFAERALRAGAMGYIKKQEAMDKVIEAIRQVMRGKIYLSGSMVDRMLNFLTSNKGDAEQSPIETLSDRELEVFELIGQGRTTQQIAKHLHLSVKTIETYRESIKRKLNLESGNELTRHAIQWVLEQG